MAVNTLTSLVWRFTDVYNGWHPDTVTATLPLVDCLGLDNQKLDAWKHLHALFETCHSQPMWEREASAKPIRGSMRKYGPEIPGSDDVLRAAGVDITKAQNSDEEIEDDSFHSATDEQPADLWSKYQ